MPEGLKFGHWGNSYPAHLTDNDNKTFLGLDEESRLSLALLSPGKLCTQETNTVQGWY